MLRNWNRPRRGGRNKRNANLRLRPYRRLPHQLSFYLPSCGDSLELEDEVLEDLFHFTRHIIYSDKNSSTMAEARSAKWKTLKKKTFVRLPPDADSLRQHCLYVQTTWRILCATQP